jgi:prophage antirepressor-like protein
MADQYLTPIPFLYQSDKLVRAIVGSDGEPWFVGIDVCRLLDIKKHHQALNRLKSDERGTCNLGTPGGLQDMIIVSEPGFYRLIFSSHKPEAERIQDWVYHEVLPSIRRTGGYRAGEVGTTRANATALNAASRAVGEIRRSLGARAAANSLPDIFGKAGVTVAPHKPPQAELPLDADAEDNVVTLHAVE